MCILWTLSPASHAVSSALSETSRMWSSSMTVCVPRLLPAHPEASRWQWRTNCTLSWHVHCPSVRQKVEQLTYKYQSSRKFVFLLTESGYENKNCSRSYPGATFRGMIQPSPRSSSFWPQEELRADGWIIPLKVTARSSQKIREQVLFSYPDSVSRITLFLLWILSPITYFLFILKEYLLQKMLHLYTWGTTHNLYT